MHLQISILSIVVWTIAVSAQDTKHCLDTPYDPSQYTCQQGSICPIVGGETALRCGRACYLKEAYSCKNGVLTPRPPIKTSFVMTAQNSIAAINGQPIVACGFKLGVAGPGATPCTYCPFNNCAGDTNKTTLYPNGDLKVEVPGGQQSYTNTDGSIGYTQAHSLAMPEGAKVGYLAAYDSGYFVNTLGSGWMACPFKTEGSDYKGYDLFAKLQGLKFGPDCVSLNIVTKKKPGDRIPAWQWT